jgi:hypothetical protein
LLDDGTDVFVLDPPPDGPHDEDPHKESLEKVSERTGKRTWRIRNPDMFRERTLIAEDSNLLKWAGQYQTASIRDRRLEIIQPELMAMPIHRWNQSEQISEISVGWSSRHFLIWVPGISEYLLAWKRACLNC